MEYQAIKFNDIVEYCKANNQVEWLKKTVTDFEADKGRKITFIELKKEFATKFMPEIAPKAKEKKPSMYDIIASL